MNKCSRCKKFSEDAVVYTTRKFKNKVTKYYNCLGCHAKRIRNYRKTKSGKEVYRNMNRRAYKLNPQKILARNKLNYNLRVGNIIRPNKCSKCLKKCIPDGHHEDYSKPLEVIWLCRTCHTKVG